mgnify:CR=1 FL=1|tara:strand:- start:533 stop:709 length:177 start_codon:yes stop_codon:yes gene_type:complete
MQSLQNTSKPSYKSLLIKISLILIIVIISITLLGTIEFPSPNKDIEKIIPNEKLKIVK